MRPLFSPSLMCMDLMDIKQQLEILNPLADFYHVDIMDGHFVPNITLSPDFVAAVSKVATKPLDCHLMVTNPGQYIDALAKAGAGFICPHAETINADAFRTIKRIQDAGCKVGITLNPATDVSAIKYYIHLMDKITVMTVDPGFAGQPFIRESLAKIRELKALKEQNGYGYIIEIDGSCNEKTFGELDEAGAECFIVGTSGLFHLDNDLPTAWDKMLQNFARAHASHG